MSGEHSLSRSDRQISEWLFVLTFVTAAYFYAGGGWNQNAQFDLTRAIVERGTFAIESLPANTGDISRYDGHVYANKAPGLSLLGAIPYAVLYALEHGRYDLNDAVVLTINAYLCTVGTCGVLVALVPFLLYREGRRRGVDSVWAVLVALTIVIGTLMLPYATMFVAQVPSASLMFIAFVLARRDSPAAHVVAGVFAGAAGLTNYVCIPVALALVGMAAWHARQRLWAAVGVIAGGAPFAILLALYQKRCCGGFFTTPIATMDARFVTKGAVLGIFQPPSLDALFGITLSPYRGLFYFSPVLLMALVGMVMWFRSSEDRFDLGVIVFISLLFIGVNASFNNWEGGFGVGARYLVPLIPLWGMAMLHCRGWQKPALVALAVLSFAINFTATAVDPQPSGTIPKPLTQYLVPLLVSGHFPESTPITPPWSSATFTGHTSVNRFTPDEPLVFFRHPPGSLAAEWASFNLGEPLFGPGDARSLIPIVGILALGAAAILTRARREPRA